MAFIRLGGALVGWPFGFALAAELLQISQVSPVSNQVLVVFLLAAACAILGWLGAPYVTVAPARLVLRQIHAMSAGDLISGSLGGGAGLVLGLLLAFPLSRLPDEFGRYVPLAAALFLGLSGTAAGMTKRAEILSLTREARGGRRVGDRVVGRKIVLDTSVIIDGRIVDLVRTGFLRETLVVPRFVLAELQQHADAADSLRRERGRRGLDLLSRMQKEATVTIEVSDVDPVAPTADAKLIALARTIGALVLSNDYALNRVAELQGVSVLNMNELAKALRPVLLPGEELTVKLVQAGKEPGQALGYLEDGTMIVVENAARHVGGELRVTVMRVLQTVAGRLIFAQSADEASPARRAG